MENPWGLIWREEDVKGKSRYKIILARHCLSKNHVPLKTNDTGDPPHFSNKRHREQKKTDAEGINNIWHSRRYCTNQGAGNTEPLDLVKKQSASRLLSTTQRKVPDNVGAVPFTPNCALLMHACM